MSDVNLRLTPSGATHGKWWLTALPECLWDNSSLFEQLGKEMSKEKATKPERPAAILAGDPSEQDLNLAIEELLKEGTNALKKTPLEEAAEKKALLVMRKCLALAAVKDKQQTRKTSQAKKGKTHTNPLYTMGVKAGLALLCSSIRNACRNEATAPGCKELLDDLLQMMQAFQPLSVYSLNMKGGVGQDALTQMSTFLRANAAQLSRFDGGVSTALQLEILLQEASVGGVLRVVTGLLQSKSDERLQKNIYERIVLLLQEEYAKKAKSAGSKDSDDEENDEEKVPLTLAEADPQLATLLEKASADDGLAAKELGLLILGAVKALTYFVVTARSNEPIVDTEGAVYFTGENGCSQALDAGGSRIQRSAIISQRDDILQVVAGANCTFFLTTEGDVYSFGKGDYCRLGLGHSNNTSSPAKVTFPVKIKKLSISQGGYGHGFATGVDDKIYVWGDSDYGKLGTGETTHLNSPQLLGYFSGKVVSDIACGYQHSAAACEGKLYTWGLVDDNRLGQRPSSTLAPTAAPLPDGCGDVKLVACGQNFTLAATEEGQLLAAGHGAPENNFTIIPLDDEKVVQLAAGEHHGLILTEGGNVWSFGSASVSGTGSTVSLGHPTKLEDLSNIMFVACCSKGSVAITPSCEVYGWGHIDCTPQHGTPTLIEDATGLSIRQVSGGSDHCAWYTVPPTSAKTSSQVAVVQKAPFTISLTSDTFSELCSAMQPFSNPQTALSSPPDDSLEAEEREYYAVCLMQLVRANVLQFVTNRLDESEIDEKNIGVLSTLREILVNNLGTNTPEGMQRVAQTAFAESWAALLPKNAKQRTALMLSLLASAQDELSVGSPLSSSVMFLAKVVVEAIEVDGQFAKSFNLVPTGALQEPVDETFFELTESLFRACTGIFLCNTELVAAGKPAETENPFLALLVYLQQFLLGQRLGDKAVGDEMDSYTHTHAAIARYCKGLATAAEAVLMQITMQDCISPSDISSLLKGTVLHALVPHLSLLQTRYDENFSRMLQIIKALNTLNCSLETTPEESAQSLTDSPPEEARWLLQLEELLAHNLGLTVLSTVEAAPLSAGEKTHSEWLSKQLFSGGLKESGGEPTGRHGGLVRDLVSPTPLLGTTRSLMQKVTKYAKSQWLMTPVVDKEHQCVMELVCRALACQLQHHGLVSAAVMFADDSTDAPPPPALAHVITTTFAMRNRLYAQLHSEYPHLTKHSEDEEALFKEEDDLAKGLSEPVVSKLKFLMERVRSAIPMEESIAPQRSTVGDTGGGYFDLRASAPVIGPTSTMGGVPSLAAMSRDDSSVLKKGMLAQEDMNEALWKPMSVVVGTLRRYQQTNKVEVEAARKDLSRQIEDFAFDMELKVADMEQSFACQQTRAQTRLEGLRQSIELVRTSDELLPSVKTYLFQGLLRGGRAAQPFRDVEKDIQACSRDTRSLLEEKNHELMEALLSACDKLALPVCEAVSASGGVTGAQRDLLTILHGLTNRHTASDVDVLVANGILEKVLDPVLRMSLAELSDWRKPIFTAGVRAFHALLGAASLHAESLDLATLDYIQNFVRTLLSAFIEEESSTTGVFLDFLHGCLVSEPFCACFSSQEWVGFFLDIACKAPLARDRIIALRTASVIVRSWSEEDCDGEQKKAVTSQLARLYSSCLALQPCAAASQFAPESSDVIGFSTEPASTLKCGVSVTQDRIFQTQKAKMKDNGFAFGNMCFTSGVHSFKYHILIDRENDESFALGLAGEKPEQLPKFSFTKSKWTWLLRTYKGTLYHRGEVEGPELGKCSKGDIITMEVDLRDPENGTLTIYKNGTMLGDGPAFKNVVAPVYPFVAFYNGHEECFISLRLFDHVVLDDSDKAEKEKRKELNIMFPSSRTTLLQEVVEFFRQLACAPAWASEISAMLAAGLAAVPASLKALAPKSKMLLGRVADIDVCQAHLALQHIADAYSGTRLGCTVDSPAHGFGKVLSFLPSGNTASVYFTDSRTAVTMAVAPLIPVAENECKLGSLPFDDALLATLTKLIKAVPDAESMEAQFLQVLLTKAVAKLACSEQWIHGLLAVPGQSIVSTLLDLAARPLPVKNLVATQDLERTIYYVRELLHNSTAPERKAAEDQNEKSAEESSSEASEAQPDSVDEEPSASKDESCEEITVVEADVPEEVAVPEPEPQSRKRTILSRVFTFLGKEEPKPVPAAKPQRLQPSSAAPKKEKRKKRSRSRDKRPAANSIPDQRLLEAFFDFDTRLGSIGLAGKEKDDKKSLKKVKFKGVQFTDATRSLATQEPLVPPPKLNTEELNQLVAYVAAQLEAGNVVQVTRVLHFLLTGLQIQLAREAVVGLLAVGPLVEGKPAVNVAQLDVTKLIQLVRLVVCGRATAAAQDGINRMTTYLMEHCKSFSDKMLQYCIRVLFSMADAEDGDPQFSSDHDALNSAKFAIARDLLTQLGPSHPCYYTDLLDGLCVAALSKGAKPNQRSWCTSRIATIVITALESKSEAGAVTKNKSQIFSQFLDHLHSVLATQLKVETRRSGNLTLSVFMQSLVAIAYMTGKKYFKEYQDYSLLVDSCKALHFRDRTFPPRLLETSSMPVDPATLDDKDLAHAQDNSKWTAGMDEALLEWKNTKPEDWSNPTDVFCAGDASNGALGNIDFNPPTPLLSDQFSTAAPKCVQAGESCTFLLDADGAMFSVGKGDYGRLGNGGTANVSVLSPMSFGDNEIDFFRVSHGGYGTGLAVDTAGCLWVWGDGDFGKLGLGDTNMKDKPTRLNAITEAVKYVYAGNRHSACITEEGELYVWGQARYRNHGDITSPKLVAEVDQAIAVACGECQTIVLSNEGHTVHAWGENGENQLGLDGGDRDAPAETAVDIDDLPFVIVEAGDSYSALLSESGRVYVAGSLAGSNTTTFTLVEELANEKVVKMTGGKNHLLVLTDQGAAYAWGSNSTGQCGTGGSDAVAVPTRVELLTPIRDISAGAQHSVFWSSMDSLDNLLPSSVPPQFDCLADAFGVPLLVRLKLLQKFSDTMFRHLPMFLHAGREWFHFNSVKGLLTLNGKMSLLDSHLASTMNSSDHGPNVTVNRFVAKSPKSSVFCQVAGGLSNSAPSALQCATRAFRVDLSGEGSYDAGGPYNDVISSIADELMDCRTPVTELTANGKRKEGNFQDCVVPAAAGGRNMESLFVFLGMFLGIAIRTRSPVQVTFPPIFWKLLLDEPAGWADLAEIDTTFVESHQLLVDLEKKGITEEAFDHLPLEMFPPLRLAGGGHLALSFATRRRYVQLAFQQRMTRWDKQLAFIRRGISSIVLLEALALFTWEEVAMLVCGSPSMDWARLRASTTYGSGLTSSSDVVKWLWEVLATFSDKDASRFLRFVWGKSRLPRRLSSQMVVEAMGANDNSLPKSATCFFKLSLPLYSSKEILEQRIRTAITYCTAIDTDNDTGLQGFDDTVEVEPALEL